ncbi:MAG: hypothetical protein ACR2PS_19385, partial [Pseudomonadales bacterium]
MQASVAIIRLGLLTLFIAAANVSQACTITLDEDGRWNSDDCTLAELFRRIGPELEYISVEDAQGLCDATITQHDMPAGPFPSPYVISNPGIYCVAEDLEVYMDVDGSAIEIQSGGVGLWFLRHELRNSNPGSNGIALGPGLGSAPSNHDGIRIVTGTTDIHVSRGSISGFRSAILTDSQGANIARVSIDHMEFATNYLAIALNGVFQPSIRENTFEDCQHTIGVAESEDVVIADNTVLSDEVLSIPSSPHVPYLLASITLWHVNGAR